MYCTHCGTQLPEGAAFCYVCGASVKATESVGQMKQISNRQSRIELVKAKCTNCGESLEVDREKRTAICPFCKQAYIVEEAINNYVTNIEHANVHVNDDRSARALLQAAEAFIKLEEWAEAEKKYSGVCDLTPQDYRGWWGRIRAHSEEFTKHYVLDKDIDYMNRLFSSVVAFVPKEKEQMIKNQFFSYIKTSEENNRTCKSQIGNKINELSTKEKSLADQLEKWRKIGTRNIVSQPGAGVFIFMIAVLIWGIKKANDGSNTGDNWMVLLIAVPAIFLLSTLFLAVHNAQAKKHNANYTATTSKLENQLQGVRTAKATYENAMVVLKDELEGRVWFGEKKTALEIVKDLVNGGSID